MRVDVMVVAAHPDDEVIGMSVPLARHAPGCLLVHTTDGAPRDMADAARCGFGTREEYARVRRRELYNALTFVEIGPERCVEIGFIDQEATYHLLEVTEQLRLLLEEYRPRLVFTHPYEGGHPDHDATAFCVHQAAMSYLRPLLVHEFTSYHAGPSGIETFTFLPSRQDPPSTTILSEFERDRKRRMMECFETQREMLSLFPIEVERYRPAPPYDFREPPHHGRLHYENYPWGMDGARWRALAAEALNTLGR
jgi:N-acetylglucosamine malate deacetylase 2